MGKRRRKQREVEERQARRRTHRMALVGGSIALAAAGALALGWYAIRSKHNSPTPDTTSREWSTTEQATIDAADTYKRNPCLETLTVYAQALQRVPDIQDHARMMDIARAAYVRFEANEHNLKEFIEQNAHAIHQRLKNERYELGGIVKNEDGVISLSYILDRNGEEARARIDKIGTLKLTARDVRLIRSSAYERMRTLDAAVQQRVEHAIKTLDDYAIIMGLERKGAVQFRAEDGSTVPLATFRDTLEAKLPHVRDVLALLMTAYNAKTRALEDTTTLAYFHHHPQAHLAAVHGFKVFTGPSPTDLTSTYQQGPSVIFDIFVHRMAVYFIGYGKIRHEKTYTIQ